MKGATGNASGPHLHFEIHCERRGEDPLRYLPALPTSLASPAPREGIPRYPPPQHGRPSRTMSRPNEYAGISPHCVGDLLDAPNGCRMTETIFPESWEWLRAPSAYIPPSVLARAPHRLRTDPDHTGGRRVSAEREICAGPNHANAGTEPPTR